MITLGYKTILISVYLLVSPVNGGTSGREKYEGFLRFQDARCFIFQREDTLEELKIELDREFCLAFPQLGNLFLLVSGTQAPCGEITTSLKSTTCIRVDDVQVSIFDPLKNILRK